MQRTKMVNWASNLLFGLSGLVFVASHASAQGPITQHSTGNCSPNIVGNGNTTTCVDPVPPDRKILAVNAKAAIAILKSAPTGSTVQFELVGRSQESDNFSGWVAALFQVAQWNFMPSIHGGQKTTVTDNSVTHGEGIECDGQPGTASFDAATKALKAAGYPCRLGTYFPMPHQTRIPDILVEIGPNTAQSH